MQDIKGTLGRAVPDMEQRFAAGLYAPEDWDNFRSLLRECLDL